MSVVMGEEASRAMPSLAKAAVKGAQVMGALDAESIEDSCERGAK